MQYRRISLFVILVVPIVAGRTAPAPALEPAPASQSSAARPSASRSWATRPAATQLAIPSDPRSIREFIMETHGTDCVRATDAAVRLKMLAKRGVPVWDFLEDTDPASVRQLVTWLRDHPGDINHPSPLRMHWESMDLFVKQERDSDKTRPMGNAELVEYAKLAREMARDGDPYGYYATLDVARLATELLARGPDYIIFPYILSYLNDHLELHAMDDAAHDWKGYWAKPLTVKRKIRSPIQPEESDGTPEMPLPPWQIPTQRLLEALDLFRADLDRLGLWLTPPWERQYTQQSSTPDLLKGMTGGIFPARQYIWRLLVDRMGDPDARKQLAQAINQKHPHANALQLALDMTTIMPYGDVIRRAWPKELAEQCPGTLDNVISSNPRRQVEGTLVSQTTLLYWPDRSWANQTAVKLFEAGGAGATEFSIAVLMTVDNKEGVAKLIDVYRKGELPDASYNALHRWMHTAAGSFRTACADKDLAPLILRITAASQPSIDTSKSDWSKILRMAYELAWWELNKDKLYWNEQAGRLEVPAEQLAHPTEEQIIASYSARGDTLRELLEAGKTHRVDINR